MSQILLTIDSLMQVDKCHMSLLNKGSFTYGLQVYFKPRSITRSFIWTSQHYYRGASKAI